MEGVRVIDLTRYIAGPYCTKLLADYGADVIKIERPGGGDPARRLGPFSNDEPNPEALGLLLHLNTNKKSVTPNLKEPKGREVLLDLVREADILVESFSPHVMENLGLDYSILQRVNPHLVMASLSNFGQTGPYRDYKLSEIALYALGGTMHSTGEPGREPVKLGLTVGQFFCGALAASAAMGAFLGSALHGSGQYLDLSLYEFMVGNQDRAFTALTISGRRVYLKPVLGKMSKTPLDIREAAPTLGKDNEYVYKELLGYSETEYRWFIDNDHVGETFLFDRERSKQ